MASSQGKVSIVAERLTRAVGKAGQGALDALHGFTEGLHADLAERAAAPVGHQHHGNPLLVGDGAQNQVFAGEQAFQVAGYAPPVINANFVIKIGQLI